MGSQDKVYQHQHVAFSNAIIYLPKTAWSKNLASVDESSQVRQVIFLKGDFNLREDVDITALRQATVAYYASCSCLVQRGFRSLQGLIPTEQRCCTSCTISWKWKCLTGLHLRNLPRFSCLQGIGYYYLLFIIYFLKMIFRYSQLPIPTPQLRAVALVLLKATQLRDCNYSLYDLTFVNHHLLIYLGGGCKTFNTHMQRTPHLVYIHITEHHTTYHILLYCMILYYSPNSVVNTWGSYGRWKGGVARSRWRTEFVAIFVVSCLHVRFVCEFS